MNLQECGALLQSVLFGQAALDPVWPLAADIGKNGDTGYKMG